MNKPAKWILALLLVLAAGVATLFVMAQRYKGRLEPYVRQQTIAYLERRFRGSVELGPFRMELPALSPVQLFLSRGSGVMASVTTTNVVLRKSSTPLLKIRQLRFEVDLGRLTDPEKSLTEVFLDGMELRIPPREKASTPHQPVKSGVTIERIHVTNSILVLVPKDPSRVPMEVQLHRVELRNAGVDQPMTYDANLRIPKPDGEITATGHFGPFVAESPGDTALDGDYRFDRANLAVFSGITGILQSTGHFEGALDQMQVRGQANVPDFSLKVSGNKLPLSTEFEAEVDGTNGNTILKPVHAQLGKTKFVTGGGIIKHEDRKQRAIDLDVVMPAGRLEDVLLLAMKGNKPFMTGVLNMKSRISLPPDTGKVISKLLLNGQFVITEARFLQSGLQERIDHMSRQAQGEPKNEEIDEVVSNMSGKFRMANETVTLQDLAFGIPGADLALNGDFNLAGETLDFHGTLKLKAKLSQTQTGWKRILLKPVDPFFAKNGAGLFAKIKIQGTRQQPKFGLDR